MYLIKYIESNITCSMCMPFYYRFQNIKKNLQKFIIYTNIFKNMGGSTKKYLP